MRSGEPRPPESARERHVSTSARARTVRTDLQALRAFAVLAVVGYHLWPGALPGGYVGVDVFFVISGYLITDHLLRSHRKQGRVSLSGFWAARARRLLPAALTVLFVSILATLVWAPPALRGQYLQSVIASTLYVENWQLAAEAVDYLGQENAPSIAQHFWSLSVEEQFYVVWPLLIVGAGIVALRSRRSQRVVLAIALIILAAVSLSLSIWWSITEPGLGYFSTFSRMWEFAVGAAVAIAPSLPIRSMVVRSVIWTAAWASLAAVVFAYDASTTFPGPAALWPTLATAALIAVGPTAPVRLLDRAQSARPLQWIGDHSYGVYLWHWPLVVIAPWALGSPPTLGWNLAILATSLLAAAITKKCVEDPVRFGRYTSRLPPRRIAMLTVAGMVVVVGAAAFPQMVTSSAVSARTTAELANPDHCLGATAMLSDRCTGELSRTIRASDLTPAVAPLLEDTGGAYRCYDQESSGQPISCTVVQGEPSAPRVALVGDSHAAMLIPALEVIAKDRKWTVDVYVGRGCRWYAEAPDPPCAARHAAIGDHVLTGEYDLLIETWRHDATDDAEAVDVSEALAAKWNAASENGTAVAAVLDNPAVPDASARCLLSTEVFNDASCTFARPDGAFAGDPLRAAAERSPAELIDLSKAYCHETCPVVAGGVIIYRDGHHITASYSTTLSSTLGDRLDDVLTGRS